MKKRFLIILAFVVLFIPKSVLGLSVTPAINCNVESLNVGESATCDVSVAVDDLVTELTLNVDVSSNLELITPSILGATNEDGVTGNITLGTIKVTAKSSGSATITLNNIKANGEDFSLYRKEITIIEEKEEAVYLSSLSVEGETLSPAFSKDVLEYSITTSNDSINISATSEFGEVTGVGEKKLKSGNNKFEVTVSSANLSKTYVINVLKKESSTSSLGLKKINLSSGSINFKSDTFEYDIVLDSSTSSLKITAEPNDSKFKIKFSPNSTVNLDYGETKKVTITVSSESNESVTYTLNITREKKKEQSNLSSDAGLKSLSIKGISFNFNPNVLSYNLSVENDITHADIEYEPSNSNSKVSIIGNTTLKVGLNTINVIVTSESGNTKTYTLNITRNKSRIVLSNNEEEIINKINDDGDSEDIYVNVSKDDEKVVSKNILDALNKTKKSLIYEVLNEDGGLIYSVKFVGGKLKFEDAFNYELLFVSDNENNLTKLVGTNMYLPVNFKSSNSINGELIYKIYVGDKIVKDKKALSLYKFNPSRDELNLIKEDIKVKDGFVEVKLDEISEYVLAYIESKKSSINENILIPSILLPVLLITVLVCLFVQKNKSKQAKKETD